MESYMFRAEEKQLKNPMILKHNTNKELHLKDFTFD